MCERHRSCDRQIVMSTESTAAWTSKLLRIPKHALHFLEGSIILGTLEVQLGSGTSEDLAQGA